MGCFGPVIAIVLAPLIGVLAVRPAPVAPPEREGESFSAWHAFRFAAPVLACMAFAQALMNGGPILARVLDGSDAQVSVFSAALIFTRIPQYVLSPAIGALLPRASRVLSTEGRGAFDRFVAKALGVVGLVGVLMVAGTWMFGEWGLRLFAGAEFDASLAVLVALATMAAFYLLSDALNQGLFALGTRPSRGARVVRRPARLRRLPDGAWLRCRRAGRLLPGPRHLRRRRGPGYVLRGDATWSRRPLAAETLPTQKPISRCA